MILYVDDIVLTSSDYHGISQIKQIFVGGLIAVRR